MGRLSLLLFGALATACGSVAPAGDVSRTLGEVRTEFVVDAVLLGGDVPPARIVALIAAKYPRRHDPRLSDAALARRLAVVSDCFGLDTAVFTGLVRQESAFTRTAVSPTGATGLTQFTIVGIREVDDQFGERGASEARTAATAAFQGFADDCVVPRLGLSGWTPLWRRLPRSLKARRDHLRQSADDALIYGAVLLKTEVSVARTLSPGATPEDWYVAALERYNGDPDAAVRLDYQRRVLAYAAELR